MRRSDVLHSRHYPRPGPDDIVLERTGTLVIVHVPGEAPCQQMTCDSCDDALIRTSVLAWERAVDLWI